MSRFSGYIGGVDALTGGFVASDSAFEPASKQAAISYAVSFITFIIYSVLAIDRIR